MRETITNTGSILDYRWIEGFDLKNITVYRNHVESNNVDISQATQDRPAEVLVPDGYSVERVGPDSWNICKKADA